LYEKLKILLSVIPCLTEKFLNRYQLTSTSSSSCRL